MCKIILKLIVLVSCVFLTSASTVYSQPQYSIEDVGTEIPEWWTSTPGYNDNGEYVTISFDTSFCPNGPYGVLHMEDGTEDYLCGLWGDDLSITDLNNLRHIVGSCDVDHVIDEGEAFIFIWSEEDGMVWIGNLAGILGYWSTAVAINNYDQIVGISWDEYMDEAPFFWDRTYGMFALDQLIPSDSGWSIESVIDINDSGQIIGEGVYQGEPRFYLMTPEYTWAPSYPQSSTVNGGKLDHKSNLLNYLSILIVPSGAILLIRIIRRKK